MPLKVYQQKQEKLIETGARAVNKKNHPEITSKNIKNDSERKHPEITDSDVTHDSERTALQSL